jgi:uncharacterized protein (TIGR03032 family)
MANEPDAEAPENAPAKTREVSFECSRHFVPILEHLKATLLVSTYQAGKLVALSVRDGKLALTFVNFDRPMGVAVQPGGIAVACRDHLWYLRNAPDIAPRLSPEGRHDALYLARQAVVTGEIQSHEMAFVGSDLWVVNTLFSCLATPHSEFSFVPRWRPSFISGYAAEDRCHLNGLAIADGRPKYVTAMAETDTAGGWRPTKVTSGCVIDVTDHRVVARGFAMPHSPRWFDNQLWVLNSGHGQLTTVDLASGAIQPVVEMPGYTRGLAMHGQFAFVGLSKIRETSTFGGMPIAANIESLKCGVGVVDLLSRQTVATFQFVTGVDEIFDVTLLPGVRDPAFRGPHATQDGENTVWIVPDPRVTTPPASAKFVFGA